MTKAIAGRRPYQRGPGRGEAGGGFWDLKADRSGDLEDARSWSHTPWDPVE